MKTKRKIYPLVLWGVCALLVLLGIVAWFAPGYRFSGLFLLGLAALFPIYHFLSKVQSVPLWKGVKRVLTVFLCVLFAAMAVTLGFLVRTGHGNDNPDSPYVVVLGAGVNGTVPSRSLRERLDAALGYLEAHPESIAIVSGGQGEYEDISEAQCMFDFLTIHGIDSERVWMEDQAENTLQNLQFSLDLIESRTGTRPEKIAIVSSEYHLHRANLFARWLDLDTDLIPARTERLPLRWNYYLREIFAVWYYSIFGGLHHA